MTAPRRRNRRRFIGGLLAAGGAAGVAGALGVYGHGRTSGRPTAGAGAITVVRGGTLIDGTGAAPVANAALVVQDRKIQRIGRAADVPVPRGAHVVDATGKWIIPGLVDAHVHLGDSTDGLLLLAHGVTTVRDVGNFPSHLQFLMRDSAPDSMSLPMPSVFGCGQMLTGDPPLRPAISVVLRTADEAKAAVEAVSSRGFSGVKAYANLTPQIAEALIAEAHRRGLPVTMHASLARQAVSLTTQAKAIELGVDGLEHAFPAISDISSRYPLATSGPFRWVDLWKAWSGVDFDAPETQRLVQAAVAAKIAWTPTLAVMERATRVDQSDVTNTAAYRALAVGRTAGWASSVFSGGWGPEELAIGQAGFEAHVGFTGRLHAAGVNLLAGSDMNNPYTVPGLSMQRELELLVQAGLSPMEALQAGTVKPAQALRRSADFGTLEPGKQADLVILGGDPIQTISNVSKVEQVMRLGRLYSPSDLLRPGSNPSSSEGRPAGAMTSVPARICC